MGWGAVYAQYLESMDQISGQGNGLSVSRQLYKGDEALNESAPLKVGDKITVRLTVKADRDMDLFRSRMTVQLVWNRYRQFRDFVGATGWDIIRLPKMLRPSSLSIR